MGLASRLWSPLVSGEKSLLRLSQPGEFSSCFLRFVFLTLLEVSCLLFADAIYMDDSTFCHLTKWRTSTNKYFWGHWKWQCENLHFWVYWEVVMLLRIPTTHMWLFKFKLMKVCDKIKNSIPQSLTTLQQPPEASGYCIGQWRWDISIILECSFGQH